MALPPPVRRPAPRPAAAERPGRVPALHRAAAAWSQAHGLAYDAVSTSSPPTSTPASNTSRAAPSPDEPTSRRSPSNLEPAIHPHGLGVDTGRLDQHHADVPRGEFLPQRLGHRGDGALGRRDRAGERGRERVPIEPISTIRPRARRNSGSSAWETASCPVTLTSSWRRNCSTGMISSGPNTPIPALFTSPVSPAPPVWQATARRPRRSGRDR